MSQPPHHRPGGGYQNPWPGANPRGFAHLVRWFFQRNFTNRPPPDPPRSAFSTAQPAFGQPLGLDAIAVTWLGHSTVVVELPGVTVLTDPVLGSHAAPFPTPSLRRWVEPPVPLAGLPRVDIVLLSHNHYDHLDAPTVRDLAARQPDAEWCTPLGNAALLRSLGVKRIVEFDWWEQRQLRPGVGQAHTGAALQCPRSARPQPRPLGRIHAAGAARAASTSRETPRITRSSP